MKIRTKATTLSFLVFIGLWIATCFAGRQAVARRIFDKEVHEALHAGFHQNHLSNDAYPYQPTDYFRIGIDQEPLRYPAYEISTWTPFPLVVVGRYYVTMGTTQGSEFRRIYLWILGPIAEFDRRTLSAS